MPESFGLSRGYNFSMHASIISTLLKHVISSSVLSFKDTKFAKICEKITEFLASTLVSFFSIEPYF